ncbi:RNA ligase [Roseibium sp. SCP14]|uniref:RNA ligase n=1 Tax=Roseibium sp. SCP14 TaxID=3141375 RepID=UPI003334FCFD
MFVELTKLEDILPNISLGSGISLIDRGSYLVLDYNYIEKDLFNSAYALECRGLKFSPEGTLLARPFHKFFNLGEKQQPEDIDFSQPHLVQEKLDGSMVHPCVLEGELVFMTRKGKTDHADQALGIASDGVLALCAELLAAGVTPIFEFTSPENRIVVAYDRPELTLLGARHTKSGRYLAFEQLCELSHKHRIPLVKSYGKVDDIASFSRKTRGLKDVEGCVITFADGHRLKLKADAYVLRHRALEGLKFEKTVLSWIAEGAVDDVIPLLRPDAQDALHAYVKTVENNLAKIETDLTSFHAEHKELARKDYALRAKEKIDARLTNVVFALLDGRDARTSLLNLLSWAAHTEGRADSIRDLTGASWVPPDLASVESR